jgi:hypothetical protein
MLLFRLIVFLLLVGSMAAVAVQNMQLLPLVLLGQKTISLPLSAWLLIAMGIGALTSSFLTGVIEWTAFWSRRRERKSFQNSQTPVMPNRKWNPFGGSAVEEEESYTPPINNPQPPTRDSGYRSPKPPREVVDADFRVIKPPTRNLEDE